MPSSQSGSNTPLGSGAQKNSTTSLHSLHPISSPTYTCRLSPPLGLDRSPDPSTHHARTNHGSHGPWECPHSSAFRAAVQQLTQCGQTGGRTTRIYTGIPWALMPLPCRSAHYRPTGPGVWRALGLLRAGEASPHPRLNPRPRQSRGGSDGQAGKWHLNGDGAVGQLTTVKPNACALAPWANAVGGPSNCRGWKPGTSLSTR